MSDDVTYERPVKAKLVVRLATGEEWDATADDFARFDLRDRVDAECAVTAALLALGFDPDKRHGSIRHVIQMHVAGSTNHIGRDTLTEAKQLVADMREGEAL